MKFLSLRHLNRSRWTAVGAAVAVTMGSGGLMSASATIETGEKPVFVAITPCRVMDTRPAPETIGPRATPLGAAETHTILVIGANGNCVIPAGAVSLALNVTAIGASAGSFLTVFPDGAPRPLASNLNFSANQAPVPNAVTVKIGTGGRVSFFNLTGTVNVAADIVGYYEDHNHNDLYYTKTQVDASLALKANLPITSANILDGTILAVDLADGAVTSAKVLNNSLTGVDIADGSLNGDTEILDNSITTFDLATNSVDSDEVLDFTLSNQDVNVFYAVVNPNGTLNRSSGGGVTSVRNSAGNYDVNFGRSVAACSWVADTETGVGFTDVFSGGAFVVNVHHHTASAGNALVDGVIHLQVVC